MPVPKRRNKKSGAFESGTHFQMDPNETSQGNNSTNPPSNTTNGTVNDGNGTS